VTEAPQGRKIPSKAQIKPKAIHRLRALTEDEEAAIGEGNASRNYVTQRDVLYFVEV
jgi:hypothetical protein